jgi:hypothetical protein
MLKFLISTTPLSKTEEDIIIDIFSSPVVNKYLMNLGLSYINELASLSVTERDSSEVAKKHALVQGKLSVIETLLSINKPKPNQE